MAGSISNRGSELLNQIEAIIDEELRRGLGLFSVRQGPPGRAAL